LPHEGIRGQFYREKKMMVISGKSNKEKHRIKCQRCKGWMAFEKFYGLNDVFSGWHCVMCGDIIDPVSLLHRISQDAEIAIPETEENIISLIKRYMSAQPKEI
jgi:hypothetical protein